MPFPTSRVDSFRRGIGLFAASAGIAVLAGWRFDNQTLKSIYPGLVSMKPNAAIAFVLCGVAVWALQIPRDTGTISVRRVLAISAAATASLIGLLTLFEYLAHVRLGVDDFLFRQANRGGQFPGRMSPFTACGFILLGAPLLLLEVDRPFTRRLSRFASSLTHVMALTVVFGYAYSGRFLFKPLSSQEMAVHSAVLFVLLSAGILCVRPDEGLVAALLRKSPGGTVMRRAVPISLAAAFSLGWLRLEGQRLGLYGTEVGVALLVVSAGAVFVFATMWAAKTVDAGAELLAAKQRLPDMLQLLVERIPEYAIIMLDPAGQIATWNRTAELLKGYRAEEVLGKNFSILYVPEDVASGKPARELELAALEGRHEDEGWRKRKNGSRFWANVVITALRDERGELRGFGKITRDLTERKRAADRFRLAIDAAPTGMIVVGEEGKIVLVNTQVEKLFGYDRAELLMLSIEALVPVRFRNRHPEFRAHFFADPKARPMGAGRDLFGLKKDGTEMPIEIALTPLEMPEGEFVLASVVDITERKRVALEIQQSKDLLEKFVEYAPASIAMFDRDMRYVVASRRWLQDCGMGDKVIIGESHYEVIPIMPEHWKVAHQRGLAGETSNAEDEWVALDGAKHSIRWEIHPWGDAEPSTGGIIIFMEDITERKQAEDSLRAQSEQLRALSARLQEIREEERSVVARDLHGGRHRRRGSQCHPQ